MPTGQRVAVDVETTNGLGANQRDKRINPDDWCKCGCGRRVHITMVAVALAGEWDIISESFPFAAVGAENLPQSAWNDLLRWLSQNRLEFWNAPFDLGHLHRGAPNGWTGHDLLDAVAWDGMLASWVLWPLNSIGLDRVGKRVLGVDRGKKDEELKTYLKTLPVGQRNDYWRVPFPIQGKYNAADAALTYEIVSYQHQLIEEGYTDNEELGFDPTADIDREFRVMKTLVAMQARGIGFDKNAALATARKLEERQREIESTLPFRPTNAQAIKYWQTNGFRDDVDALPRTKLGSPSLDVRGIKQAVGAGLPGAKELDEYRALTRGLGLWFGDEGWPMKVGEDGRLRTEYKQTGAITMRFSSTRVTLQAIPQEQTIDKYLPNVRELFVPKPGHVLVELDLSNAELRIATGYARCEPMLQHFVAGTDIHDDTTHKVFGLEKTHPRWDDYRRDAKIVTFAMLYGAGPDGLVLAMEKQGRDIDYQQAYRLRDAFRNVYPEFYTFAKQAARVAEERGYIKLITGRRRYFGSRETFYKGQWILIDDNPWDAFNGLVQGGCAEATKAIMLYVEEHWPGYLLLNIHDSMVLELPKEKVREVTDDVIAWTNKTMTDWFKVPMVLGLKVWGLPEAVNKDKKLLKETIDQWSKTLVQA